MNKQHYWEPGNGYRCEYSGKLTSWVWTDHARPGVFNACEHCAKKIAPSVGTLLHRLNAVRAKDKHD